MFLYDEANRGGRLALRRLSSLWPSTARKIYHVILSSERFRTEKIYYIASINATRPREDAVAEARGLGGDYRPPVVCSLDTKPHFPLKPNVDD